MRLSLPAALLAALLPAAAAPAGAADPAAVTAQSTSSFATAEKDGQRSIDITNISFATTPDRLPGRPEGERLVLRTTVTRHEVIDEVGIEGKVTVEAFPLGKPLEGPPVYSITHDGVGAQIEEFEVLVFDRGTEEVEWWSVHALGTGAALFDTHVAPLRFSLSSEVLTPRYVGFEVPPDDAADKRLTEPQVLGVLAYAAEDRVIRRVLLTCSDTDKARQWRAYADTERELSLAPRHHGAKGKKEPPIAIRLSWSAAWPSGPDVATASFPVKDDDLDLAKAKLPPCVKAAAWEK
ncbi:MAG: hypothetical protein U1E53_33720 [Dongiaceae bacterium]